MGGITRYILDISKAMPLKGIRNFVISSGGDVEGQFIKDGIPVFKLDMNTKFEFHPKIFFAAAKAGNIIRENKIDIMHCHTRAAQVLGCLTSRMASVKYVSTCHGFFNPSRLSRRIFPCWGEKVIAISRAVKDHLVNDFGLKADKVDVIFTGVKYDSYKTSIDAPLKSELLKGLNIKNGPVIGTVGRLSPVKGQDSLIRALKLLKRDIPNINCIIIGDGHWDGYLKKLAVSLGVQDSVHFIKALVDAKKYLPIFDVYVFPSRQEGLGMALLEAMASKRACIASKVGGIVDIIDNGRNGILIGPDDPGSLYKNVKRLIENAEFRRELGDNALDTVRKKFAIEKTAEGILKVYNEVLKSRM